jgi:hypothetical protein
MDITKQLVTNQSKKFKIIEETIYSLVKDKMHKISFFPAQKQKKLSEEPLVMGVKLSYLALVSG